MIQTISLVITEKEVGIGGPQDCAIEVVAQIRVVEEMVISGRTENFKKMRKILKVAEDEAGEEWVQGREEVAKEGECLQGRGEEVEAQEVSTTGVISAKEEKDLKDQQVKVVWDKSTRGIPSVRNIKSKDKGTTNYKTKMPLTMQVKTTFSRSIEYTF